MATFNPIDFVNRALSEDEGRYNMNGAYREKDRLVGTDGHRLHMVSGLVNQDKGGFVDGRDAEFPNYEAVIPKEPLHIASVKLTKKQVAYLNKVLKVLRDSSCGCTLTFDPKTGLTISGSSVGEMDVLTFSHSLPSVQVERSFTIGLNLRYFVEALISDVEMVFKGTDETSATVLEADFQGSKYTAIIMPLRKGTY